MQLFLKLNSTYVIDIDENATVGDLHEKILDKTGIPKKNYFLTSNGKYIENIKDAKLSNYKMENSTTVHMSLRCCPVDNDYFENQNKKPFQVFVKFDKTNAFDVNEFETVESLKEKIQQKLGYKTKNYFLVANSKILQGGLLTKYKIEHGSTIWGSFRPQFCEYHSTLVDNQVCH
jgi:hypothetical protein